jgi:Flp pilus assembly CpaE family ATPase
MLGVAYQTVERWEHNRRPISAKNRAKIIAFIGFEPDGGGAAQADDAVAGNL